MTLVTDYVTHTHGCDEIQGYYSSKPVAASEIPYRLRNSPSPRFRARAYAAGNGLLPPK